MKPKFLPLVLEGNALLTFWDHGVTTGTTLIGFRRDADVEIPDQRGRGQLSVPDLLSNLREESPAAQTNPVLGDMFGPTAVEIFADPDG
ncbi:MAG: hypothetical protein HYY19_07190 [Candidatus Rokubacteria bacterium]|nr:hypothetical protein [Candidatus Rokubacteria bacterium]